MATNQAGEMSKARADIVRTLALIEVALGALAEGDKERATILLNKALEHGTDARDRLSRLEQEVLG